MIKRRLTIPFLNVCCFVLLQVFCSCSGSKIDYNSPEIDELKSAPEKVKIGSSEYYIEAYLWRDLMPVLDPKDVSGLFVNVKVKTLSGGVPDSILVTRLWVINKDSVWDNKPEKSFNGQSNSIEYTSRDGPFWKEGIRVDVVVLLQYKNQKKLLQAKEQRINAVY